MKALKLTVYPQSRGMFGPQYDMPNGRHMLAREGADVMSRNKRLTDAELAAEYWRAKWTGVITERSLQRPLPDEYRAMIATVERFMELPHYDDPTETGNKR